MSGLLGFPKLLVLAAIVFAVWYFMRRPKARRAPEGKQQRKAESAADRAKPIEDMVQCRKCGAYVPATSVCSCGNS